jgi:DNA primase
MTIYELLKRKIDIVEYISQFTDLTSYPDGTYRGKCPIHGGDNKTSLMVTPKSRNGTYPSFYCNSCGAGGSVLNFVQYFEKLSYEQAIEFAATWANIDLSQDETYQRQKTVFAHNYDTMMGYKQEVDVVLDYLTKRRGLTEDVIDTYNLGWDEEKQAITIPIRDHHGRTVGITRRFMYAEPKYKNPLNSDIYEKSKTLFNLDRARRNIRDRVYIVEGYFDAIVGDQQGFPTVAYCTSEISKDQIDLIKEVTGGNPNITILLGPDNDEIGEAKLIKMRDKFIQVAPKLNVRILKYPGRYWREESDVEYYKDFNDLHLAGIDIGSLESEHIDLYVLKIKLNACKEPEEEFLVAEEYAKTVQNAMIKATMCGYLAKRWGQDVDWIKNWLSVSVNTDEDVIGLFKDIDQLLGEYREMIDSEGFGLGYPAIDASLRNMRSKEVLLLGAYASVGKTFYAMEFAKHLAIRQKMNVLIFSLEMPGSAFMERLIANIMGTSTEKLEEMAKTNERWLDIYDQVKSKLEQKIKIVDKNNLTIQDIDRMIKIANGRMLWKEGKTDVVIIDYFQYLKNTHNYETASQTARELKAVAKEGDVLLICLSQLSRAGNDWERPTMQMLKTTGDLEASADVILLGWRPGRDPNLAPLDKARLESQVMLTIAKARRGIFGSHDFEHRMVREETRIKEVGA